MKVLLAIVSTDGAAGVHFAVGLLRLQTALQVSPTPMEVAIAPVPSICAAVKLAAEDAAFDAVVAIRSTIAFSEAFVLRALAGSHPFVSAVFPLPTVDWARVRSKAGSSESPASRGNTYNVDAATARIVAGGYAVVRAAAPGAYVLRREAIEALRGCDSDAQLCRAWGRDIHADLDSQCATSGPMEYVGCIGTRAAA